MKNLFITIILSFCFVMGQELPGWAVYVGGAMCAVSGDDFDNAEMNLGVPNIGVMKGIMLGGLPLIVGIGSHKRGYKKKTEFNQEILDVSFLDGFAMVPYPVGSAIFQGGFYVGAHAFGKEKNKDFYQGEWSDEIENDTDSNEFDTDYGVLFGVAYPIGPVGIFLAYQLGLAEHSDDKARYNGIHFNVGYNF
ncbi:MAG: hypothetical protein ACJZ12_03895 [Candidatus Neomarinimicrobiota bacterium]